jgi:hypothetical protein
MDRQAIDGLPITGESALKISHPSMTVGHFIGLHFYS